MNKNWCKPTSEELLHLKIKGLSNKDIGKMYGVSDSAISRLLKKYKISDKYEKQKQSKIIDLIGQKFGKLTVIRVAHQTPQKQTQMLS